MIPRYDFEVGAAVEGEKSSTQVTGKHLWDICEYDKVRVIKIYQASCLIVVLAYMKNAMATTRKLF
jgi:hypothetical protein